MINELVMTTVEWSRAQFALTAMFHYLFVPLTLGLSLMIAIMETLWLKTGNEAWKHATKFWMKLFGINFAIGVSTGIILEFEFGTNWSNYSWFVGDIFGAPLAIEGIMAFFMESTFIAVMFFGWNKVKPKFHLASTWLVFLGSNLSALWILVANAWMQNPVGMYFNPDTARNEMIDFWAVLFSSTAMNKFFHTLLSAYLLSAVFVLGVSSWFILKKRHEGFARKSILIASIFGLSASLMTVYTGDTSSRDISKVQPMKFAAMEGLYEGGKGVPLVVLGQINKNEDDIASCTRSVALPNMLSFLTTYDSEAFIPGIKDIIHGYIDHRGIPHKSLAERISNGKIAVQSLKEYHESKKNGDKEAEATALASFKDNYKDFGYGYLSSPKEAIPNVYLTFYSFRIMVGLGFLFIIQFIISLYLLYKKRWNKYVLWLNLLCIPLAYLATQAGWIVAELGRQPWVIQDLMPTSVASTEIASSAVQITFWLFAILFTTLLTAEIKILVSQIKKGPQES